MQFLTDNEMARQKIMNMIDSDKVFKVTIEEVTKQRTNTQNASIHLYCDLLAEELNNMGLDVQTVMQYKNLSMPWDMNRVKDLLWREVQMAMFDIKSTAKLNTDQVSKIYNVLSRHIAQTLGVSVPFPSRFYVE